MNYTPRPGDDKPQEPKPGPFPPPPPGVDRGSAAWQVLLSIAIFLVVMAACAGFLYRTTTGPGW